MTDAERIARYKPLNLTAAEERDLLAYDKAVDKAKPGQILPFDLSPEVDKIARKFARADSQVKTAYKFTTRQRKPNATKGGLIAELAKFLEEKSDFEVTDISITNKERQIFFRVGDAAFDLTLVQKRKPKGG